MFRFLGPMVCSDCVLRFCGTMVCFDCLVQWCSPIVGSDGAFGLCGLKACADVAFRFCGLPGRLADGPVLHRHFLAHWHIKANFTLRDGNFLT